MPEKLEAPRILCSQKERLKSLVSARGETLLWEETSDKLGDPLTGETGVDKRLGHSDGQDHPLVRTS